MKTTNNKLPEIIIKALYADEFKFITDWLNQKNVNYLDKDGRSLLFHAIFTAQHDLIDQILKNNPNLDLKDKIGWYPMHYAVQEHLMDVVDILIKKGANIEVKDSYGNTPLWRAVFSSKGRGEIIELLLLNGADPDNPNNSGVTPFKLANTISNYNVKRFFN